MDKLAPNREHIMLASAPLSQQTAFSQQTPNKEQIMLASAPLSQQTALSQLAPNKEQKTNWSLSGVETTCKSED